MGGQEVPRVEILQLWPAADAGVRRARTGGLLPGLPDGPGPAGDKRHAAREAKRKFD